MERKKRIKNSTKNRTEPNEIQRYNDHDTVGIYEHNKTLPTYQKWTESVNLKRLYIAAAKVTSNSPDLYL